MRSARAISYGLLLTIAAACPARSTPPVGVIAIPAAKAPLPRPGLPVIYEFLTANGSYQRNLIASFHPCQGVKDGESHFYWSNERENRAEVQSRSGASCDKAPTEAIALYNDYDFYKTKLQAGELSYSGQPRWSDIGYALLASPEEFDRVRGRGVQAPRPAPPKVAAAAPLTPPSQVDWYCELTDWSRTISSMPYSREKNSRTDSFRLRIVSNTVIRVTGSDLLLNGDRQVRREGSRYYITDRHSTQGLTGTITPLAGAYFDSKDGTMDVRSEAPYLFGLKIEWLYQGTCE